MDNSEKSAAVSRRALLTAGAVVAAAPIFATAAGAQGAAPVATPPGPNVRMTLTVNGQPKAFSADLRTSLLDALREHADMTGSKKGCDQGQCGACTVHVDGRRVLSCLTLAVSVQGKAVTTIEGLGNAGALHPMQQAFIDHDAFQCGYCTPGQIMSAVALVSEGHAGSDDQIREYMSGNLCRCAAYPNIVAAINDAKGKMPQAQSTKRA
jgi:xanthine dehydrogenase YagT iron-sulfur-binding subunit